MYHLDFETYSAADLREVGPYRYGADPSTEILLCGIAKDDGPVHIWVHPEHASKHVHTEAGAIELLEEMGEHPEIPVCAHNRTFEAGVSKYRWMLDLRGLGGITPAPERWLCTAAMARAAALPASLADCAAALRLGHQKDKRGSELIRKFSVPQRVTKNQPHSRIRGDMDPEAFREFAEYCRQDVRVEQAIYRALKPFAFTGAMLETWKLDARVNDRGIPVNVKALLNARVIVEEYEDELGVRFKALTGYNYTQRDRVLEWLRHRGFPFRDTQANTLNKALADTSWAVQHALDLVPLGLVDCAAAYADVTIEALTIRQRLGFAAVKKVYSMLNCECGDGVVRGTLKFYGAGTGRWSAELIQPQNFKRPTFEDTHGAYRAVCEGADKEDLKLLYGDNVWETLAGCIRHFIQRPDGMFLDADYAAIEARIVCWLAGQLDALEDYRNKVDAYVAMACRIFNKVTKDVNKDERWLGKQSVLGCGFGMWIDTFMRQCESFGRKVPVELAEAAVLAYREKYDKVPLLWDACEKAAKQAIQFPGKAFRAGPHLKFGVSMAPGVPFPFLVMVLPSGRKIVYPDPRIEPVVRYYKDRKTGETKERLVDQITFWGKDPFSVKWTRISTYGGKLVENATQGTAWDIMGNGACRAEEAGYEVVTLIHDQVLVNHNPELGTTKEGLVAALCALPPWAEGLPIDAECTLAPYYQKG